MVVSTVWQSTAFAQSACASYRVKKGDSLHTIAERVDGVENYWALYKANRRAIGRNPSRLRIGTLLRIPCASGARARIAAPKADPETIRVSFLTANGYEPYLDGRISEE